MKVQDEMGRFSVEFAIANNRDVIGLLEELDLLVDCAIQALYPRDPNMIIAEIE